MVQVAVSSTMSRAFSYSLHLIKQRVCHYQRCAAVVDFIAKGALRCVRLTGSSICQLDLISSLDHVDQTLLLILAIHVENMSVTQ